MLATRNAQVRLVIIAQLTAATLAPLLVMVFDLVSAVSTLVGGMAAVLPNALFARVAFVSYRAQEPRGVLHRLYAAELLKLVSTGLIFASAVLCIHPINMGFLFGAFFLVQLVPLLVSK